MSAEIVNLRRARKAKARAEDEGRAAANRARFGQTKPAREREQLQREKTERDHAGKKLER